MSTFTLQPAITPLNEIEQQHARFTQWVHHHPAIASVASIALMALGNAYTRSPDTFTATVGLVAGIAGVVLGLKMLICWNHFVMGNVIIPLLSLCGYKHQGGMHDSVYTPKKCFEDDNLIGEIAYEKCGETRVPIMTLYADSNYGRGYAHAYLLGDHILDLLPRLLDPMLFSIGILAGDPYHRKLEEVVESVEIPDPYDQEFDGMLAGLAQFQQERKLPPLEITKRDLKMLHCFMDAYKAIGHRNLFGLKLPSPIGCTTVAVQRDNKIWLASNLDWLGGGLAGRHPLIRKQSDADGGWQKWVTLPGFIGMLRGRNSHGVRMVLNECGSTGNKNGVPYVLFARNVLENARSAQEAREFYDPSPYSSYPASSHLCTIADETTAVVVQTSHKKTWSMSVRHLNPNGHLVVTNHEIDSNDDIDHDTIADGTSLERHDVVHSHLTVQPNGDPNTAVVGALQATNRVVTVMSTVLPPESGLQLRFDNYHSASHL